MQRNMQQNQERNTEKLMDEYLRENGLYRKKIAKDGSCLFRAVAEQVLHCQALHTRVRAECVKYLRQNRDQYESFIEGDFEEYLHMLQDPKSWVGQVEISALAVLYKHDFIIYRQPGEPPVNITEHGYSKTVLLCFLNGNHYDSVYPIPFIENAAMCQSILYELLYDGVYGVDRSVLTPSLRTSKAKTEAVVTEERESSEDSDLDEGEDFWCVTEQIQRRSSKATGRAAGVNNRTAYKGRGRGQGRGLGRGCLLPKVRQSLNPNVYRNAEYEMWLRSNRVQQKKDFCIAAGMHYRPGDKCQAWLNTGDRFYSAYIQEVSSDDGPVTVFIEELQERYTIPLWNLRTFSEDSSSKVTEKSKRQTASSNNGPPERVTRPGTTPMRSVSHGPTASPDSASVNNIPTTHQPPGKNDSRMRSGQEAGGEKDEHAPLEILNKDEENFPTLEASAQAASVEGSRRAERRGSRKKVCADTKEQSPNLIPKAQRGKAAKSSVDQEQRVSPPPKEDPKSTTTLTKTTKDAASPTSAPARVPSQTAPASSTRPSDSFQTPTLKSITAPGPSTRPQNSTLIQSQTATASSPIPQDCLHSTPKQSQDVPSPSLKPVVDAQATRDSAVVTPVSPRFTLIQPQTFPLPSASSPVSSQCTHTNALTVPRPIPVTTNPVLPQNSSETLQSHDSTASIVTSVPLDHVPKAPTTPITTTPLPTDKSVDDKYSPFTQNPARKPYISLNVSAPTTELCLPTAAPAPSPHPAESYLYEPAVSNVSAGAGGALVTNPLTQLCQDLLYPGFPQNDNKEHVQPPHFSYDCTGSDLPNDTSVLRFFFNLGLKAFTYQMFAPISYLGPLVQAYRHMQLQVPSSPVPWQPDNNSRPVITNSSPAEGTPVSHFELRGIIRTPAQMDMGAISHTSLPMRMPLPVAPHPTVYTGMCPVPSFGPPLQYLPPPTSHLSMPPPPPPPYATAIPVPTVAPIMEGAHEGQRSQVEKTFWAGQSQPPLVGGDIKIGAVPVTMEMQHSSGAQAVPSDGGPGIRPATTILTNGNRQSKGGGFSGSSLEGWETETAEFGDGDVKTGQSFHSQYKSGSRHGQDDRGGYRGHGLRGRREYTGWGRQDGQLPYHRGSGGRGRRRSYNNTSGTGYGNRQFTHAPES